MEARINRKCHDFFLAWTAETRSTIKVLFILYFVSDPESESEPEPESESIKSPESEPESESEQPHHDSAPLPICYMDGVYLTITIQGEGHLSLVDSLVLGNINRALEICG